MTKFKASVSPADPSSPFERRNLVAPKLLAVASQPFIGLHGRFNEINGCGDPCISGVQMPLRLVGDHLGVGRRSIPELGSPLFQGWRHCPLKAQRCGVFKHAGPARIEMRRNAERETHFARTTPDGDW
jgi:hypothetical protein